MTEYTNQMMLFKDIFSKQVHLDFDGGDMSSNAGLVFLREVDDKHQIIKKAAEAIHSKGATNPVNLSAELLVENLFFQMESKFNLDHILAMTPFL